MKIYKVFPLRLEPEMWEFLKVMTVKKQTSMNKIITELLVRYRNRNLDEKKVSKGIEIK